MRKAKTSDADFLAISAITRSREAKALTSERLERMVSSVRFDEAVRLASECGYPELPGLDAFGIERALTSRRAAEYAEIARQRSALPVLDLFRIKYDYHNVKALVKSMGANVDASRLLSECGRIPIASLTEAFISGERRSLPAGVAAAMSEGVGILSRTSNPQLSDICADSRYYMELEELSGQSSSDTIKAWARLLTDSANLRTFVRSVRTRRQGAFLRGALFSGGNSAPERIAALPPNGEGLTAVFNDPRLAKAVLLAGDALAGGSQTAFERECDNASNRLLQTLRYVPFGGEVLFSYLLKLDWEIMSIRTVLTGKLAGIASAILTERLREKGV